MNYINKTTNEQVTEYQIYSLYPNTSFPRPFVAPEEFALIFPSPRIEYNQLIEILVQGIPVLGSKGNYSETWVIAPKFSEYTDENGTVITVEQQQTNAIAQDKIEKLVVLKASVVASVQKRLDEFAQTRNYDSILSACTYSTSNVVKFKTEGQFAVDARDSSWAILYQILADIQDGKRPMISSFADIELEFPTLTWPE
jgi:hypothetical protein